MAVGVKKCPECGGEKLYFDTDRGEIHCRDCGFIIDDKNVSLGKEWRDFEDATSNEMRRSGAPTSYTKYDLGMGTSIGSETDSFSLDKKHRYKLQRLKKWQKRLSTVMEKNLKIALGELRRLSSLLNLPTSIEEDAGKIYTEAVQKNLVRGRSIESVVAGVVYAACRRQNIPRTLDEISEVSGINKKEIGRSYRYVTRELRIKILPSNPIDYISRFASLLNFGSETQSRAVEILSEALSLELTSGRGPIGIAAASLYIASILLGERRTQRDISETTGVTEVTIRNRYKEIIKKLDLEEEIKKIKLKDGNLEEEDEKGEEEILGTNYSKADIGLLSESEIEIYRKISSEYLDMTKDGKEKQKELSNEKYSTKNDRNKTQKMKDNRIKLLEKKEEKVKVELENLNKIKKDYLEKLDNIITVKKKENKGDLFLFNDFYDSSRIKDMGKKEFEKFKDLSLKNETKKEEKLRQRYEFEKKRFKVVISENPESLKNSSIKEIENSLKKVNLEIKKIDEIIKKNQKKFEILINEK